ncbi:hypothetical protein [Chamaesiphon sp. GL140_3_metabinner_50]|uniref:hypothetical protein n=1 Tax=Chamaesiphon sp. GL140_3_metabinner_50 TaxID=2970812 RepID=UPI0025E6F573|nr:hypothetical protein [Chamaesiphon sp. GL140_3_metabinner_50]
MSHYFSNFFKLVPIGLIILSLTSSNPVTAQPAPPTENTNTSIGSYVGIGGAIGLGGNTTSLGSGGVAILSKARFTDNLSLHDATVLFGKSAATSMIILTADFPIRNNAGQTIASPFIGGGAMLRYDRGLYISPAVSGGIDLPLSKDFIGTVRINAGFPSNRSADVGFLVGAGYNFGR